MSFNLKAYRPDAGVGVVEYKDQLHLVEYNRDFNDARLLTNEDLDHLVLRMGFLPMERIFSQISQLKAFLVAEFNAYFEKHKSDAAPLTKERVFASMSEEKILAFIEKLEPTTFKENTPRQLITLMDTLLNVPKFKNHSEIQDKAKALQLKCYKLGEFNPSEVGKNPASKLEARKRKFPNLRVEMLVPSVDIHIPA